MLEPLRRLRYYFRREAFERELEEEMRHHLALKAEEAGSGVPFGNVTLLKEESRAMWNWNVLEQAAQDVRYAARAMRGNRLFTATAALSLALGIGANAAIYSFLEAILLRALPIAHPEELAILKWRAPRRPGIVDSINGSAMRDGKTGMASPDFPYAALASIGAGGHSLSTMMAYTYATRVNLVAHSRAGAADAQPVSGNFFTGLGVAPAVGRLFSAGDDRPGAPLIAILSYDYWRRRFAEDPSVAGQTVLADNLPLTIVGVSAPGFFGLDPGAHPDLFIPLHTLPMLSLKPAEAERQRFFDDRYYWLEMTARLRPGIAIEQAQAEFSAQFHRFAESTARSDKDRRMYPELWLEPGASGLDSLRRGYSRPLRVLMTMVALILTIACANLANLLLARSAARRREMAVRLSLGAGRWRIVRQLLTESLMLAILGGALGVGVAYWGIRSITWLIANGRDNFTLHAQLNWPVLGFTIALTLLTGVVFGLAPALNATRLDLTPSLKTSKTGETRAHRGWTARVGATRVLVTAQIALSLLLVMGAALFVRNLNRLESIDLGFNREKLLLFSINPRQAGYQDEAAARFFADIEDHIRQLPGVRGVGLSSFPLVSQYMNSADVILADGSRLPGQTTADLLGVDPDFLGVMQIPILVGRGIEARDLRLPQAVVVSQKFASTFFSGANPLGQRFSLDEHTGEFEIVGVARDAHYNSIQETVSPVAYLPFTHDLPSLRNMTFNVRTAGEPLHMVNAIREIVHQANPLVVMVNVNTQSRTIDQTIGQQRTFSYLGSCFAALALLIACVGLYGAMAYAVARRTGEIGIRMALGAQRRAILWMVVREVLALAALGLAIGYFAARETARWVESFLFDMKPTDATATALAVSILFAAALGAGFLPAWRASRIHPMTALRDE